MQPKIVSLGFAVPEISYTQEEVFQALGYPHHFRIVFSDSRIEKRHFILPLERVKELSFQEQQDIYMREAPILSRLAVEQCLDGRDVQEIGLLIYATCTGLAPGPTIAHYLARDMKFLPSTFLTNITAMGCEGAYPGLRRAYDFVVATGRSALLVNCELTSLTYYPESDGKPDPENHFEVLRSTSLFADAASAALVSFDDDWHHPTVIDMETYTNADYMGDLGFTWRNGRLRVLLSRRVPELAPLVVKPAVDAVLQRQELSVDDIRWWVIHAAGSSVLDNIRDALGLPEEKVILSRETLKNFGNTSSTSVGITGKRLMSQDIQQGDYVMILSVGPGMTGGCLLLKFGG